jgi:translation initiation factor 2 subunit 2
VVLWSRTKSETFKERTGFESNVTSGYSDLLKRAKSQLPEQISQHERFQIPAADLMLEGKTTVLRNFEEVCQAIRRDPEQVLVYLLREIGTAGAPEGRRVVFKGRVTSQQVEARLKAYVETYVLCSECSRPDTRLVKEDRITMLECDACGARRPVKAIKKAAKVEEAVLEEGKVYEVMIQDIGKKGDGIAKMDKYIIYIPGTAKGAVVKVMIEKVSGTIAFGRVHRE